MNETTRDMGTNGAYSESATPSLGSISQPSGTSDNVRDKAGGVRQAAAGKMHAAADIIRQNADRIPGGERIRGASRGAADKLEASASYLESHGPGEITSDAIGVVRRFPVQALLIAGALGFLMAWAVRRRN